MVAESNAMAGGGSGAGSGTGLGRRWDVALSFSGAQRAYVERVAAALKARGIRCFYDADEQVDLWGRHLAEELPAVYAGQAAVVVVFISAEYAAGDWTRLERQAALAQAARERREYVLPARFDDTVLPGLLGDVVAVDLRHYGPDLFAGLVADKLASLAAWPDSAQVPADQATDARNISPQPEPLWAAPAERASQPPPTPVPPTSLVRTLRGHNRAVLCVAFSSDGQLLATAGNDASVRLWDPVTGDCLRTLIDHPGPVWDVAFSPDGQLLATASIAATARLWDLATGDCLRTLTGHTGPVWDVAFSVDGRLLATASKDATALLWDPATGRREATLVGHTEAVLGVAFSPDGQWLGTASGDGTARLWDLATGKRQRTLTGHTRCIWDLAFSPDRQRLATASGDGTARLWDLATGEHRTLTGHTGTVWDVAFSPDGQLLATAGNDGTARVWD